jgi:hypothetical protein
LATRVARGNHATAEAFATVGSGNYAQIRVCPQRVDPTGEQGIYGAAKQRFWGLLQQARLLSDGAEDKGKNADAFKSLSASWWLSAPVQQYLHQQLSLPHNRVEIERVRKALDVD